MLRLFLLLILVLLSACRSDITYRVLLVGDSLADFGEPAIRRKLIMSDEAGFKLDPNPIFGTGFAHADIGRQYWLDRGAALFANTQYQAVVVSLGINDATANADPSKRVSAADMQTAAARFIALYGAGGRPIFWLLPHTLSPDNYRQEVVASIRIVSAPYPQVHFIDLEQIAGARGIAFADLLLSDGIHLNDQGNTLLADVVHDMLAADAHARGLD